MPAFTNHVAIVTGSAKGIGLGVARHLAAQGARVVVSDIDAAAAEAAAASLENAVSIACDVRDEEQVKHLVNTTVDRLGRLDLMVANAGVGVVGPMLETDLAAWRTVTSVNLDGTFLSMRHAAPAIIASGGGSIVTIASVTGTTGMPLIGPYAATKAAIINLSKTMATELREHGVRVNSVLPGFLATDLVMDVAEVFEGYLGLEAGQFSSFVEQTQGGFVTVDEVARTVAYLADPAQVSMTGATVTLDGGLSAKLM
ncbi:SDR family oxidoreductase [Paraconexibacter sp. AEG42_29]|uniref:SDR family NAD(P)-dependent oxidoreductase n=1 Tax=Paraconexibacter sp. AEG42_29 TaxID=2997339 RepID=UPI00339D88F5